MQPKNHHPEDPAGADDERPAAADRRLRRRLAALARAGLDVSLEGHVYRVRLAGDPHAPPAEVLLPEGFPVEGKALRQLAELAAARHPAGGHACRACASPDFHPGDAGVAIGSVVECEGMVIPAAVGSDINCGMRLHVVDLDVDRLLARRDPLVEALRGDFFFGTRDLPMDASAMRALFREGAIGWLDAVRRRPLGMMARVDLAAIEAELERVHLGGALDGDPRWAPEDLVPSEGTIRDGGLATIGGGNHFVELQVVDELVDRRLAYAWGLREGQVAFMIHSGSRGVGKHVGALWRDRARALWPKDQRHPESGLFALSRAETPAALDAYLEAEASAANYGFVNRLLLAELLRQRLREVHGDLAAPLVYDLPHNITLPAPGVPDRWITRKGACPAAEGQPVIIPGSMGASSYLLVGRGSGRFLASASHGAGRARSRFSMGRRALSEEELGLGGVDCITLREERRIEEAPAAYKPIGPVIECQVDAGMVDVVARMRPLMTFKA
ncbi:MAG: RtcB family protein [Myxococcales bacterium]|nr:RtcB family protein [Myxococcales bacterium]